MDIMLNEPVNRDLNIVNSDESLLDKKLADLFDFATIKTRLNKLIGSWSTEIEETETRRKLRYTDVDVDELRATNKIDPDATYIPDRVIDVNITREHPTFAKFLKGSRRLAIFKSLDDPRANTQQLELDFTEGLTYPNWYIQFFREVDGAMTHGWDALEVVLDITKPLHIRFDHIGHDNLYFNKDIEDFQSSELVIRRYKGTALDLENNVTEYGFDEEQVDLILNKNTGSPRQDEIITFYKLYFKCYGIVYVAYFSKDNNINDWLKAPEPLDFGLLNEETGESEYVTEYPIFLYIYREDEDKEVTSKVGRAYLDEYRQDAHSAILTSFVNTLIRSQFVFGSPEDSEDGNVKQLDIKISRNMIMNKKILWWKFPNADPAVLQALQYLGASNANQTGQLDYAVINRKDARKTAEEMRQASSESDNLKTVGLTFYAEHLRDIFSFTWKVVRIQALFNQIKLAQIPRPVLIRGPLGVQETGQIEYYNDVELISQNFSIRAAGETDVIQREETITSMKQDWAVIQNTPLAMRFLSDLLRLQYPSLGDEYAKLLEAGDPVKSLLQSIVMVLQGALQPDEFYGLPPQKQQELQNIEQQVMGVLGEGAKFIPAQPKRPKVTNLSISRQPDGSLTGQKVEQPT